jgi:hypothetical protein
VSAAAPRARAPVRVTTEDPNNFYGTIKFFMLVVVPPALTTAIAPVVAPAGTVALM